MTSSAVYYPLQSSKKNDENSQKNNGKFNSNNSAAFNNTDTVLLDKYQAILINPEAEPAEREAAILFIATQMLAQQLSSPDLYVAFVKELESNGILSQLPRTRANALAKKLLEQTSSILPIQYQIELCAFLLEWSQRDKRIILARSIQIKHAQLLVEGKLFQEALELIHPLTKELSRIDDKNALLEVQLLEGRVWMQLRNLAKAKAAFTAARTTGNQIVAPPLTQASLDVNSGMLYVEEGEPVLAYANFIEALDAYNTEKHEDGSILALELMILAKILAYSKQLRQPKKLSPQSTGSKHKQESATAAGKSCTEEIAEMLKGKLAAQYASRVQPMVAMAEAYSGKSVAHYDAVLKANAPLIANPFLLHHLTSLYDALLEENLLYLCKPYSAVQLTYLAESIGLPVAIIEARLCQMILDGLLRAVIDQEIGALVMLPPPQDTSYHAAAMETLKHLENVVEGLYTKASKLH